MAKVGSSRESWALTLKGCLEEGEAIKSVMRVGPRARSSGVFEVKACVVLVPGSPALWHVAQTRF